MIKRCEMFFLRHFQGLHPDTPRHPDLPDVRFCPRAFRQCPELKISVWRCVEKILKMHSTIKMLVMAQTLSRIDDSTSTTLEKCIANVVSETIEPEEPERLRT